MKTSFTLGMGLGIAAGATAAMLVKPRQKDVKRALDSARQTLDQAVRKLGS